MCPPGVVYFKKMEEKKERKTLQIQVSWVVGGERGEGGRGGNGRVYQRWLQDASNSNSTICQLLAFSPLHVLKAPSVRDFTRQ